MNCDCVTKIRESLKENFPEAELPTGFSFPDMELQLYLSFTYLPEGKKKRKEQTLICSYCPFCGKKTKSKE